MAKKLFDELDMAIRQHLPPLINNNLVIQQGKLASQNSAALGAIHHFMKYYLADPKTNFLNPAAGS